MYVPLPVNVPNVASVIPLRLPMRAISVVALHGLPECVMAERFGDDPTVPSALSVTAPEPDGPQFTIAVPASTDALVDPDSSTKEYVENPVLVVGAPSIVNHAVAVGVRIWSLCPDENIAVVLFGAAFLILTLAEMPYANGVVNVSCTVDAE
jgi:hypothetical protein